MVAALDLRDASLAALFIADLIAERPEFFRDALCQEYRGRVEWFPTRGQTSEPAKGVCRRCLVRAECLAWALERPDVQGVWGATSAKAREHAREAGLTAVELIDAVDTRSATPTWETAPCRGCAGLLSRKDVERADGWCWACRPVV